MMRRYSTLWCLLLLFYSDTLFASSSTLPQAPPPRMTFGFTPRVTFDDIIGSKTIKESLRTVPHEEGALLVFAGNDPSLKLLLSEALAHQLKVKYLPLTASSLSHNMLALCSSENRTVLYVEDAADAESLGVCRRYPFAPLIIMSTKEESCKGVRHFCTEVKAPDKSERREIIEHALVKEPRASELTAENIEEIALRTSNFTVDELYTLINLTVRTTSGHLAARHFNPATRKPRMPTTEKSSGFGFNDMLPWFLQFPPLIWGVIVCLIGGHLMTYTLPGSRRCGKKDLFDGEFDGNSMKGMVGMKDLIGRMGGLNGMDRRAENGASKNSFDPTDCLFPPDLCQDAIPPKTTSGSAEVRS